MEKNTDLLLKYEFFRARFESDSIGYLLFPILVLLVIPYLLIGIIGAGKTIRAGHRWSLPALSYKPNRSTNGLVGVPPWLTGMVVSLVVLSYVFMGGSRGAAFANTFQTIVFMIMGLVAFVFIINALGGINNAEKYLRINEKGWWFRIINSTNRKHSLKRMSLPNR